MSCKLQNENQNQNLISGLFWLGRQPKRIDAASDRSAGFPRVSNSALQQITDQKVRLWSAFSFLLLRLPLIRRRRRRRRGVRLCSVTGHNQFFILGNSGKEFYENVLSAGEKRFSYQSSSREPRARLGDLGQIIGRTSLSEAKVNKETGQILTVAQPGFHIRLEPHRPLQVTVHEVAAVLR